MNALTCGAFALGLIVGFRVAMARARREIEQAVHLIAVAMVAHNLMSDEEEDAVPDFVEAQRRSAGMQ